MQGNLFLEQRSVHFWLKPSHPSTDPQVMCVSLERGNLDWQEKGARAKCKIYHPSSFLPVLGQLHNADMWKRVCFWSALPVSHLARTVQYWRALKRKQWKQSRTKQESKICEPKFIPTSPLTFEPNCGWTTQCKTTETKNGRREKKKTNNRRIFSALFAPTIVPQFTV